MSKPFFMTFTTNGNPIGINMNQVCYIQPNGETGSVVYFNPPQADEAHWVSIDQSYEELRSDQRWTNV